MFICSVCEHGYDDHDHVSEEAMADALHWERAEIRDWTHNHGEWNS